MNLKNLLGQPLSKAIPEHEGRRDCPQCDEIFIRINNEGDTEGEIWHCYDCRLTIETDPAEDNKINILFDIDINADIEIAREALAETLIRKADDGCFEMTSIPAVE